MMFIKIKHRLSGSVLFEPECGSLKIAVEAAVKAATYLAGADLAYADLAGANLAGADLAGANLTRADLAGANLTRADLAYADLAGAHLTYANLAYANLPGADLAYANLPRAHLTRANLAGADLAGANLTRADLADANLTRADLAYADLPGADLAGANDIISAGQPNGFWALGYREKGTAALRVRIGCRDKAISEGREYWSDAEHPHRDERREVLAALDYIEAVARLRGWEL